MVRPSVRERTLLGGCDVLIWMLAGFNGEGAARRDLDGAKSVDGPELRRDLSRRSRHAGQSQVAPIELLIADASQGLLLARDLAPFLGLDHLVKIADKGEHPMIRIEDGMLTAPTGSFGDISTQSFYPPHHLTMGEGGAVNIVKRAPLKTYAESFRDWGRDCWCASGVDDTCGKRFQWQLGELPEGYDHKYIYSHLGFNLKPLDPQAAIGRVQIGRLPEFIEAFDRGADVVIGSRNIPGGGVEGWGLGRHVLSKGGSLYSRSILGLTVRDLTSGYKGFRREVLENIALDRVKSEGYSFQIELTYRAIHQGFRVEEVPIIFVDRRAGQSKMSRKIFAEAVAMVWKLRLDASRGQL